MEFVGSRPTLQEMLKEIVQAERLTDESNEQSWMLVAIFSKYTDKALQYYI